MSRFQRAAEDMIARFDQLSNDASLEEYTDTQELWEVAAEAVDLLRNRTARKKPPEGASDPIILTGKISVYGGAVANVRQHTWPFEQGERVIVAREEDVVLVDDDDVEKKPVAGRVALLNTCTLVVEPLGGVVTGLIIENGGVVVSPSGGDE